MRYAIVIEKADGNYSAYVPEACLAAWRPARAWKRWKKKSAPPSVSTSTASRPMGSRSPPRPASRSMSKPEALQVRWHPQAAANRRLGQAKRRPNAPCARRTRLLSNRPCPLHLPFTWLSRAAFVMPPERQQVGGTQTTHSMHDRGFPARSASLGDDGPAFGRPFRAPASENPRRGIRGQYDSAERDAEPGRVLHLSWFAG